MKRTVIQIELEDAKRYRESLMALRRKILRAFEATDDGSLRIWINKHGVVIDELLEELGHRFRQ